jgi:hypothetical protein
MALLPKVKLKAMLSFPSAILDGAGIDVTRVNGAFRFDLAYDDFTPPVSGIADPAHTNALLWNSTTNAYVLAPVSVLGSAGTVPEAPSDGVQYGRQSNTWTPVSTGSTIPPATVPPLMDGAAAVGTTTKYAREDHVHPSDTSRAPTVHSHVAANVTDFSEAVDDRVAGLLVAGSNISLTYDDPGNALTIASTAAGVTDGDKGDITVSLSGTTWTIDSNTVSNAKLAQMPLFTIKANNTGFSAVPTDINIAALTTKTPAGADYLLLSDTTASGALKKTLISALPGGTSIGEAPTDGAVYSRQGSSASWVVAGGFPDGDKGDITITSSGTVWTIDSNAVTFAKIQDIATDSLVGRDTAGTGDPESITLGTSLSMSGAQVLQRAALSGDVTATVDSNTTTIANGAVTLAKMANLTAPVFVGRTTAGAGVPEALSPTQATAMLDVFASSLKGLVPSPTGATTTFLRADGTWVAAQPLDIELTALAGVTSAADQVPMFTGSGTATTITVTSAARTVLDDTTVGAMLTTLGGREKLTAVRTYFVATTGSDSNSGLSTGSPFLTIQKAINVCQSTLDLAGFAVTIQVGNGTYPGGVLVNIPFVGNPTGVTILGDATTPSNVLISVTSAHAITALGHGSFINISGLKLVTITSGRGIWATEGGVVNVIGKIEFGACSSVHMQADYFGKIKITGIGYLITGSSPCHLNAVAHGTVDSNTSAVTGSGALTFSIAFAIASELGLLYSHFMTFTGTGSFTGSRYSVANNAVLFTNGAGINYFPGNAVGTVTNGGQYV